MTKCPHCGRIYQNPASLQDAAHTWFCLKDPQNKVWAEPYKKNNYKILYKNLNKGISNESNGY